MQRYFAIGKENDVLTLSSKDKHHVKNVMRMKNGDQVEVVYDNILYIGNVLLNDDVSVKIKEKIETCSNQTKVTLVVPMIIESKIDYILQKATELGVYKIILIKMERSVVKIDSKKQDNKLKRWCLICKEASEQSKRINIPLIEIASSFNELKNIDGLKYVCSTKKDIKSIKSVSLSDSLVFVIGPEGGLSSKEEEYLNKMGFVSISLGSNIMRVETVPLYILSVVNYIYLE